MLKNDIIYFGAIQILTRHDTPYYIDSDYDEAISAATELYEKIYTESEKK